MTTESLRSIAQDLRELRRHMSDWNAVGKELDRIAWLIVPSDFRNPASRDLGRMRANLRAAAELCIHAPGSARGYLDGVIGEVELLASRLERQGETK